MKFEALNVSGLYTITPRRFGDDRGFFMETFRRDVFASETGADVEFVQDNHSTSVLKGTVRGLHFQTPPRAQGKLVRCTRGALIDVAVDARKGSPTYGEHVKVELSADNGIQLWIPAGFLHGFVTLTDETDINYKCTDYYSKENDGSVLWNDEDLGIDWGIGIKRAVVSDKDRSAMTFADFQSPFEYA
jgi:dTDP-4-dehydrorhamnose 3,5-epimerase